MNNCLLERDRAALWHPCSQMKDYETLPPLHVVKAKGSYLTLQNGAKVFDAISSWWCKNLGHAHPRLTSAIKRQAQKFEHVILANTTNDLIVELSERLTRLMPSLNKVFYASEGSSAIEIALKLSVHARRIRKQGHKNTIAALANGYHGETLFALAVSDVGIYRQPYEAYLPKVHFLDEIPYVQSRSDPLWQDVGESWSRTKQQLEQLLPNLSTLILEPILQGAGGMRIFSQAYLKEIHAWCKANDIYLIFDEIMTGFSRTGKMFACQYANVVPDFLCLGKGLTSGYLPMSAVLLNDSTYDLFYDDYAAGNSFLHSHTHSGNALAAAVALETLNIHADEDICQQVQSLEEQLSECMLEVADKTKRLTQIRYIGGLAAADIISSNTEARLGFEVFKKAVELGALLRPLGNTIYWLPPLNSSPRDVKKLRDITIRAVTAALR